MAVSAAGKGHARTQRHAVEALAAQDGLDLVAFVRDAEAAALLPVDTIVVRERPELGERTSVVHPGLAPGFSPGPASERGRYVLHLGSTDPRDNTRAASE